MFETIKCRSMLFDIAWRTLTSSLTRKEMSNVTAEFELDMRAQNKWPIIDPAILELEFGSWYYRKYEKDTPIE